VKHILNAAVVAISTSASAYSQDIAQEYLGDIVVTQANGTETVYEPTGEAQFGTLTADSNGNVFFVENQRNPDGTLFGAYLSMLNPTTGEISRLHEIPQYGPFALLSTSTLNPQTQVLIQQEANLSGALATALDVQLPTGRSRNRVGFTTGRLGDQEAFGISYGTVRGNFDFGAAYATSDSGDSGSRVSVGYSW
jgi:hypothetical protein